MIADALAYAQLGWRVLPCHWVKDGRCSCPDPEHVLGKNSSTGKHPLFEGWRRQATTDATMIARWWGRSPNANLGIATGPVSNLLVLDVDTDHGGERSLVALERQHGPLPALYPMSWTGTGRGRWQAFFAYPTGRHITISAGKLGPGLDTRGTGGLVVVPPSVTTQAYRWADDRDPWFLPPEPAPGWLIDLLDPPQAHEPDRHAWPGAPVLDDLGRRPRAGALARTDNRYLLRALEAELAMVASAPEGRRNSQLNESSFNLFRFAQEGRLPADAIANGLQQAALYTGLDQREIQATIRSAASKRGLSL